MGLEDWESEQSILRWIMGDAEDPAMGLNKLLQTGAGPPADFGFHGAMDPVGLDPVAETVSYSIPTSGFPQNPHKFNNNPPNPMFLQLADNFTPVSLSGAPEFADVKPHIVNPQLLISQHQAQHTPNPAFFLPPPEHHLPLPAKRHHPGGPDNNLSIRRGPFSVPTLPQGLSQQIPLPPPFLKPKVAAEEAAHHLPPQQAVVDQLFKAAEQIQTGNFPLAQGILARLNHQLALIAKPFYRSAFFCIEALQKLIHHQQTTAGTSPFNLVLKIGAYKSFSEVSPILQFANFTCNQAILESLEGFDRIHIIDFDIGYGGQWASLMQELAVRPAGVASLRITAVASPTHEQLELGLAGENLNHFAGEINIPLEFQILCLDSLNSLPLHIKNNEAVAVNLPIGSFYELSIPVILRFVKQISPKIVVAVDRGCDRTDLPLANHVIHALQSYSNLLESLDATNLNPDEMRKIERFLIQPGIEKTVAGRFRSPEKTPHWRALFLSSGFCPFTFSNFTESQADCLVKRTPARGFHVEKRQTLLVLCWQRKELISASAWKC
ncbi:unnamed protein product [Thlaspi arvense]|uniref:Scarecrow-like protein 6 n=1 Tax=Thlaspi arvense TaxID=13288 RepID=A0AAU9RLB9_THLAR|nr:unnamed protein product [Thlaspi arvense]